MLRRTAVEVRRGFSSLSMAFAKAKVGHDKTKKAVSFKAKKDPAATKAKKGGMTHHKFRDAVSNLGYEKFATPVELEPLQTVAEPGHLAKFAPAVLTKFASLQALQPYQQHEMFSEPITMSTSNTAALLEQVLSKLDQGTKSNRVCLVGPKGVGKSTLLMQTIALTNSLDANTCPIYLHIGNAQQLVDGSSDYFYNELLGKYHQPMFTKRWVWKLKQANAEVFKTLKLLRDFSFEKDRKEVKLVAGESTVFDLVDKCHDFGKYGSTGALQFLLGELEHHSASRPVIVTVDRANAVFDTPVTQYRHTDFSSVHVSEFELGSWLLALASGERSFAKGAVIFASTLDIGAHRKTLSVGLGLAPYQPYEKKFLFDLDIANALLANGGMKPLQVAPLSKEEATLLLNFYHKSGVLQSTQGETDLAKIIHNQFMMSSGVPGYLVKGASLAY